MDDPGAPRSCWAMDQRCASSQGPDLDVSEYAGTHIGAGSTFVHARNLIAGTAGLPKRPPAKCAALRNLTSLR